MTTSFSNQQYNEAYPEGIHRNWWTLARSHIVARLLRRSMDSISDEILEIGCGRGAAVKNLADLGFKIKGVELAETEPFASVATSIKTGTDANALPETERVTPKVILLLDVIEHIPRPEEFIRNLIAHFPNVSTILVTVPACPALWSNYDEHYGHFRRYTLVALEKLATDANCEIQEQSYFFHGLYPPARLLAMAGLNRSTQIKAPSGWLVFLHRLLSQIFMADFVVFPKKLPGSSAVASLRVNRH